MKKLVACISAVGLVLLSVSCETDEAAPPSPTARTIPQIDTAYIVALCDALSRFSENSQIPDLAQDEFRTNVSRADVVTSLRTMRSAIDSFVSDLRSVGPPPIDGGDALLEAWLTTAEQGIQQLDTTLDHPSDIDTDPVALASLFQEVVVPGAGTPSALSILIGAGRPGVVVSLDDPVAEATVERLTAILEDHPAVNQASYEDKATACARFRELFADQPTVLAGVDCDVLPAVIRVSLNDRDDAEAVVRSVEEEVGVREVVDQGEALSGTYQLLQITEVQRTDLAPLFESGTGQDACKPLVDEFSLS